MAEITVKQLDTEYEDILLSSFGGIPEVKCLDHGFVRLIDCMPRLVPKGSKADFAVVQAARVSYGTGTKKVTEDRGLGRYLMRHMHTSPLEMVVFKFHISMPIFVARQHVRHRMSCLAGDAILSFDPPDMIRKGKRSHYGVCIEKLWQQWHYGEELSSVVQGGERDISNIVRDEFLVAAQRDRIKRMRLRMCDEVSGEINYTTITDVWQSGVKSVYRVTLENGYVLTMSKDHRVLTDTGWKTLEEFTKLKQVQGEDVTWDRAAPMVAVNGVPVYQSEEWIKSRRAEGKSVTQISEEASCSSQTIRKYLKKFNVQFLSSERSKLSGLVQGETNLTTLYDPCSSRSKVSKLMRQWSRVAKIEYAGEQMTYDISVSGPFENFIANGFVVHNSTNEESGRYSVLNSKFYKPIKENVRKRSERNKQVSEGQVEDVTAEEFLKYLEEMCELNYTKYQEFLNKGIGKEQARIILPLNLYTSFYWKIDLHNLLHYLALRCDKHAQQEIQVYADAIRQLLESVVPWSMEAWEDYHPMRGAIKLTKMEVEAIKKATPNEISCGYHGYQSSKIKVPQISSENKRERDEWAEKARTLGFVLE
jgi:thymidylate synthase (FAD)